MTSGNFAKAMLLTERNLNNREKKLSLYFSNKKVNPNHHTFLIRLL